MTSYKINELVLTDEEKAILQGAEGKTMAKVMKTVVEYAKILNAPCLVDIEGDGHFSIGDILPGLGPRLEMLEELVAANLKTKFPFTIDPLAPVDYENYDINKEQEGFFIDLKKRTEQHMELYKKLGLKDSANYTCTPYFPEIGNIPEKGQILAWSESSCVIYANSVLGARTNRNAVTFDLLSNIVGKTPYVGFLTDDGRKASLLMEIAAQSLPSPQLLGGIIGKRAVGDVPFITGLDRFLGEGFNVETRDYLKEFGAACAAIGAVGLYHIENITPEALESGRKLIHDEYKTIRITDEMLLQAKADFPIMWKEKQMPPKKVLMGCPHFSLRELYLWTDKISSALKEAQKEKVCIHTVICAAPKVLELFKNDGKAFNTLVNTGVVLSPACIEGYMNNELCANENVATNSNKLRDISTARYFSNDEIIKIIVSGKI